MIMMITIGQFKLSLTLMYVLVARLWSEKERCARHMSCMGFIEPPAGIQIFRCALKLGVSSNLRQGSRYFDVSCFRSLDLAYARAA